MNKLLSTPAAQFARALLGYLLTGKLRVPAGHLPQAGHRVAKEFAGVGVATSDDPVVDDYVIARLHELGIRHVRLDFSYGDAEGPAGRFLEALCAQSFRVMLHLVQPFDAARQMDSGAAQEAWQKFVATTLERFGKQIELVEVGSTVNRKRWAGYTLAGLLSMWEIAHREVRARGITLAGPSVTDFEPPFNIGLLSLLQSRQQLPDIHTDNLFSERCTEPERYDHKVFGQRLAPLVRVNLIKKARILQKIGADFGVPKLYSPAAFWTLPRIERMLPASEEKQADYLARYLLLCAASGALERAWWGPLLCHREGLIDDGYAPYPALERITHYAAVTGELANFRVRPAFYALRAFAGLIPDCRYDGKLSTTPMLEVHSFSSDHGQIHAVWTINGRAAALVDIYAAADLQAAEYLSRDGDSLKETPTLASESPVYLRWPSGHTVHVKANAAVLKDVAINRHIVGKTHYFFRENGWQGILLASTADDAALLLQTIHPERIGAPPRETTLRHARNAIWTIADPRCNGARLVVKQPVKMHLHKKFLDRFKPSKGLRSWNGSSELLRRGVEAARPVAYFEKTHIQQLTENYYISEHVDTRFSVRDLFSAYADGEEIFDGIPAGKAYARLADFLLRMHGGGIFFRDLSAGNILVTPALSDGFNFSLIDTGRIHVYKTGLSLSKRLSDLSRACNKLHWAGREQFVGIYLSALRREFSWQYRMPFVIYDAKVWLKRNIGRKAIKRLFRTSRPKKDVE